MRDNWVKTSETLPAREELVLLYNRRFEELHIGWYDGKCFNWGESNIAELGDMEISHWQPLPDDPKEF